MWMLNMAEKVKNIGYVRQKWRQKLGWKWRNQFQHKTCVWCRIIRLKCSLYVWLYLSRIYSAYAEKTDEPGVVVIINELQKKYVNDLQLLPDNNMIDIAKTAL